MKLAPSVVAALCVVGALLLARECGRRDGARTALAEQRDRRDDSTVSRLVYEAVQAEQQFQRERDSTGRVIRDLRRRAASQTSPGATVSGGSDSSAVALPPDVRDTLIAALKAGRTQDSLQLLFWRGAVAQRDSLNTALQQARDGWRREAQQPRHTITDIIGGMVVGYGIAEENVVVAGVGGALIGIPRVVALVGRIF